MQNLNGISTFFLMMGALIESIGGPKRECFQVFRELNLVPGAVFTKLFFSVTYMNETNNLVCFYLAGRLIGVDLE